MSQSLDRRIAALEAKAPGMGMRSSRSGAAEMPTAKRATYCAEQRAGWGSTLG